MSLNTGNQYISCFLKRQRKLTSILLALLTLLFSCTSSGGGGGFIPLPTTTLSSPSSISAVAGNGSVTVSWAVVNGATSYFVYSSLSSPVSHATKHTVSGTTFIDTGLSNGDRYYYVMTSVKDGVESLDSSEVSAVPGTSGSIIGKITYEDKELTASGLSGGFTVNKSMKAVRYATVDVVNVANPNTPLYTTWTNSLGMYNIPVSTSSTTVYIRVNSEALSTGGTHTITVARLSGETFGVPSMNFTLAGSANVNINVPTTNDAAGAFNILDVMTTGYGFVKYLSGNYPAVPLDVFWEPGNPYGTYFCSAGCSPGNGIYVLNEIGGDTDEYDDDVLWHEFGHFVASTYSLDDSPGGPHSLGENTQDLRLSWSEGWGDFLPGAIKTWLNATGQSDLISSAPGVSISTYVDTSGSSGFSFDFWHPDSQINSQYASNEVAVAKLLADLSTASSMQNIWSVIRDFQLNLPGAEQVNLELFWDRWILLVGDNVPAALNTIFSNRSITYALDGFEGDNDFVTAKTYTAGIPQTHTLYATGDEDFILFTAVSATYTIITSNLRNGADTYLTLFDLAFSLIAANDNATTPLPVPTPNSATALSSQIVWKLVPGDYYVSVKTSSGKPVSAGKYGSYTVSITSP